MRFESDEQPDGWYPWNRPRLVGIPDRPSSNSHSVHAVFRMPDAPLRSLRVVVDARLQHQASSNPLLKYLLELIATPPIEAHLFELGQSSPSSERVISTESDLHAYADWLTMEIDPEQRRYVHLIRNGKPERRAITSTSAQYFSGLAQSVDVQTRELLLAAHYSQADLVITTGVNTELLPRGMVKDLDVLAPDLALPVIGLYLRTQGRFVLSNGHILGSKTSQGSISKQSRSIFTGDWQRVCCQSCLLSKLWYLVLQI